MIQISFEIPDIADRRLSLLLDRVEDAVESVIDESPAIHHSKD